MTSYPSSKTYSTEIEKTQNIIVSIEEMMWGGGGHDMDFLQLQGLYPCFLSKFLYKYYKRLLAILVLRNDICSFDF